MNTFMGELDENSSERQNKGRRRTDVGWLWARSPTVQKAAATLLAVLMAVAGWAYREREQALSALRQNTNDIALVKKDVEYVRAQLTDTLDGTKSHRQDMQDRIAGIEARLEKLDERLSRWFEKASRVR